MKRWIVFLLASILATVFCACATPKKEQKPDYDEVRKRAQEASEDLKDEEDKDEDD